MGLRYKKANVTVSQGLLPSITPILKLNLSLWIGRNYSAINYQCQKESAKPNIYAIRCFDEGHNYWDECQWAGLGHSRWQGGLGTTGTKFLGFYGPYYILSQWLLSLWYLSRRRDSCIPATKNHRGEQKTGVWGKCSVHLRGSYSAWPARALSVPSRFLILDKAGNGEEGWGYWWEDMYDC